VRLEELGKWKDVNSVLGFLLRADVRYAVDVSKVHNDSASQQICVRWPIFCVCSSALELNKQRVPENGSSKKKRKEKSQAEFNVTWDVLFEIWAETHFSVF
jgi:hypothetical protein